MIRSRKRQTGGHDTLTLFYGTQEIQTSPTNAEKERCSSFQTCHSRVEKLDTSQPRSSEIFRTSFPVLET